MGIFNFFKKGDNARQICSNAESEQFSGVADSPIPEEEKKYYQPDDYYEEIVHQGQPFEFRVTRFEERNQL